MLRSWRRPSLPDAYWPHRSPEPDRSIDRKRLQAIIDDRNSPQKHVWRARIVLGTAAIMRTPGVSKTAVWRWQAQFMESGGAGLQRDKTRPPRVLKLADEVAERIVGLTLGEPPGETPTGPAG